MTLPSVHTYPIDTGPHSAGASDLTPRTCATIQPVQMIAKGYNATRPATYGGKALEVVTFPQISFKTPRGPIHISNHTRLTKKSAFAIPSFNDDIL